MGMFDYVNVSIDCPKCGASIGGYQSKDGQCRLDLVEPDGLVSFYSSCDGCGSWIEFARASPPVAARDRPRTRAEVEAMGFVLLPTT